MTSPQNNIEQHVVIEDDGCFGGCTTLFLVIVAFLAALLVGLTLGPF